MAERPAKGKNTRADALEGEGQGSGSTGGGAKAKGSTVRARARDHEVIETAVRVFWEKGYAGASMQEVADALGMLKGSLYYYIDSKESLLLKIFDDSHREISELTTLTLSGPGSATQRLERYLHAYAIWTLTHLERAGLFAREWRYAAEPVRSSLADRVRHYDKVLSDLIRQAQAEGPPTAVDPQRASRFIWAALTSLPDWYRPGRNPSAEQLADDYVDLAMRAAGVRA